ncbi:MAG: DNA gyrase subunit A [Planctomycetes bacterium]|nr:DNA gyrase subunit A [Planctomycetota bacterium]
MAEGDTPQKFANEKVIEQDIEDELKTSYLTYAMSVIVQRALPDVRDGLKPSQRRILLAMHDLSLTPGAKFKKCAKIVGECMGKYHPHGDQAIYPTLVRLAQDFSIRYPLIDGQGNFGSIDGDPPAAMRYTEARMTPAAMDLLEDLDKDTVLVGKNFDGSEDEPLLLPGKFPNLICNGSTGIAVGMATSIPPHNVGEVCDALIALIQDPNLTVMGLMKHIQGPDFPTGGYICGRNEIVKAYQTGRGIITVRSKYQIEQDKSHTDLVVTQIPYQESKENLINKIVACVKEGRVEGIADVRDESDKEGIRLVIELKRDADAEVVINQLYKHTPLQSSFSIINIALVDGRPETLNLKELLTEYKKHRVIIIRRKTRFLLQKAEARLHIVEGLLKALDHIDAIIALIRASKTVEEAQHGLMAEFGFTDLQAHEILQMRLVRLTGLERTKLEDERKELEARIQELKDILADEQRILEIIINDLKEIKERYGDPRRTEIIGEITDFNMEDLVVDQEVVVTVSREGYIKRTPLSVYRSQGRGGRGITGFQAKDGDDIQDLFSASTHDYILFFTNQGRVFWLKVYDIPDLGRTSRGRAVINLIQLGQGEMMTQQLCVKEFREDLLVLMATKLGVIKKTQLSYFSKPKKNGIIAIRLDEGDALIGVSICRPGQNIILGTRHGMAIRFPEEGVRNVGRDARGVRGIKLRDGDYVVDMVVADPTPEGVEVSGQTLLTVCENGFGKRTDVAEYRFQDRAGFGVIDIRTSERNGEVVSLKAVTDEDDLVLMTAQGLIMRMHVSGIRPIGRATQGVKLINLKEGDKVVSVAKVIRGEEGEDGEEGGEAKEEERKEEGDETNAPDQKPGEDPE